MGAEEYPVSYRLMVAWGIPAIFPNLAWERPIPSRSVRSLVPISLMALASFILLLYHNLLLLPIRILNDMID